MGLLVTLILLYIILTYKDFYRAKH
jgi:hypothetical protein